MDDEVDDRMEGDWPHPADEVINAGNNFSASDLHVYTTNTSSNLSSSEYYALTSSALKQPVFHGGQLTGGIPTPPHFHSSNNLFQSSSVYSSGASSMCPSPGPVKRFRQLYGNPTVPRPNSGGGSGSSQRYMENWMNSHHNYPSCSTSNTPSIASSNVSAISRLSALSVDTQLSVAIDLMDLNIPVFQPPLNGLVGSHTSLCENVDPVYFQQMHELLALVSQKLSTFNKTEENEALNWLKEFATDRNFAYCTDLYQIQRIIRQLVSLLRREGSSKRSVLAVLQKMIHTNFCITVLSKMNPAENQDFICNIYAFLHPNDPHCMYAIGIFYKLFSHSHCGHYYRRVLRNKEVLDRLTTLLRVMNSGKIELLYMIRSIVGKSTEFKLGFVQSGGMELCLGMFTELVLEKTLNEVARLLCCLVDSDSTPNSVIANHFILLKGIQILATRLDHGSPRLLQWIVKCLCAVSHLKAVSSQALDNALKHSIQILGCTDIQLVHDATGFLSNVQSNNPRAKEYLLRNMAVDNLMFVLSVWSKSSPSEKTPKNLIDEILDNVLLALRNLTNLNPYSCQQILKCEKFDAFRILLDLLVYDRPINVYSRVFRLLVNIVNELADEALDRCASVFDSRRKLSYAYNVISLVSQSIESLPTAKAQREQELKILIRNGFNLLKLFTRQITLMEQLKILRNKNSLNPVYFLNSLNDDETLAKPLVEFLVELSRDSDLINEWAKSDQIISIFKNSEIKNSPFYSKDISLILKRINYIIMNKNL